MTKSISTEQATLQSVSTHLKAGSDARKASHTEIESALRKLVKAKAQAHKATSYYVAWFNDQRTSADIRALGKLSNNMCEAIVYDPDTRKLELIKEGKSMVWTYVDGWDISDWNNPPVSERTITEVDLSTLDQVAEQAIERANNAAKKSILSAAKKFYASLPPAEQTDENLSRVESAHALPVNTLRDILCKAKKAA